ncbi:MazG-like family protein [Erysipelothrix amsterdamensis]|uniref:MazG-like family protein n=1 Tax=Erysipelothrix amsterdamensis TaxID=2929157 RepID=A0AAU9VIQ4_9FIRM|nr:MazG-like family protein [Erysipelothrix rhusiopathiae]MDE8332248.1 MazG-like family protein [Erysipelothrix rhusiopathiae]CAH2763342.1 MazG-like family protein [Erysipelothrix sp. A18Y020d]CAH2763384.1 MazG-like family protein [Erysipelothrix sp. A18Y020d]
MVLNVDNYELENAKDELADIVMYSMMLAEKLDLDLEEIIKEKLERNKKRYVVDEAKENGKKYLEFGMSTLKRTIFIRTVDSPVTPYLFSSL